MIISILNYFYLSKKSPWSSIPFSLRSFMMFVVVLLIKSYASFGKSGIQVFRPDPEDARSEFPTSELPDSKVSPKGCFASVKTMKS